MSNNPFREDNFRRPGWGDYNDFETTPFGPTPFGSTPAGQMPMSTPPGFSPPITDWRVGSSGIRSCLFRNTYIWLNSGRSFGFPYSYRKGNHCWFPMEPKIWLVFPYHFKKSNSLLRMF